MITVSIMPISKQILALWGSSFLITKYAITPPNIPKKMGSKIQTQLRSRPAAINILNVE